MLCLEDWSDFMNMWFKTVNEYAFIGEIRMEWR